MRPNRTGGAAGAAAPAGASGLRAAGARTRAILAALGLLCGGCLRQQAPPWDEGWDDAAAGEAPEAGPEAGGPDGSAAATERTPRLLVRAADGSDQPVNAAPRRPRLRLEGLGSGADPEAHGPWLLAGEPDEALLEDLRRRPLRRATVERIVPCALQANEGALVLVPREPLRPGGRYVVAAGAWTPAPGGEPLGAPWVAPLQVASSGGGAPRARSWPADGTSGVPSAIRRLAVRFDELLVLARPGALRIDRLRDGGAEPHPVRLRREACPDLGWTGGWCWTLEPLAPLRPASRYRIALGEGAFDRFGEPAPPFSATFETAPEGEPPAAPVPLPMDCAVDEEAVAPGCLLVQERAATLRVRLDRPARLRWEGPGGAVVALAPRGEATVRLEGLRPGEPAATRLLAEGLGGAAARWTLSLRPPADLAPFAIVEVRADPRGPEPDQEYVELLHFGTVTRSLAGLCLADAPRHPGDCVQGELRVPPGARVLLVADGFDPEEPSDPPVPPGAVLVRLGASLGRGGLSNRGEPLFLRDAQGRRLSEVPPLPSPGAGRCLVRVGPDPRRGRPEDFAPGPCTPGAAP